MTPAAGEEDAATVGAVPAALAPAGVAEEEAPGVGAAGAGELPPAGLGGGMGCTETEGVAAMTGAEAPAGVGALPVPVVPAVGLAAEPVEPVAAGEALDPGADWVVVVAALAAEAEPLGLAAEGLEEAAGELEPGEVVAPLAVVQPPVALAAIVAPPPDPESEAPAEDPPAGAEADDEAGGAEPDDEAAGAEAAGALLDGGLDDAPVALVDVEAVPPPAEADGNEVPV